MPVKEAVMRQVLSYCTARLFSRGLVPLVAFRIREVTACNDNGTASAVMVLRGGPAPGHASLIS